MRTETEKEYEMIEIRRLKYETKRSEINQKGIAIKTMPVSKHEAEDCSATNNNYISEGRKYQ